MAYGDAPDKRRPGLPLGDEETGALAPPPVIDRYPIIIGSGLTLQYISSVFRLCTTGFRQQYVDLLDEMLEKDPHAYAVISKRVLGVAGGRVEVTPATCKPGSRDETLAIEIAENFDHQLQAIPDLSRHISALAWASFYGVAGVETRWARDGRGWLVDHFSFVHPRRLSYPVPGTWDLYIWDQGMVGTVYGLSPTRGVYGLRLADYPGKFVIHAPQVRGDYPTREGLGREIAYWMALKLIGSRGAARYLERYASPIPEVTYNTASNSDKPGRAATNEDITQAQAAAESMARGSLAGYTHPDTIALNLTSGDAPGKSKLGYLEWLGFCNAEMSKAALSGTLTTEVGSTGGNRSLGDTQKKGEIQLFRNDAKSLSASLDRDFVQWWVRLNYGDQALRLRPHVRIHVEEDPDPMEMIERAAKACSNGVPVDADWLADEVGLHVVGKDDPEARRMVPFLGQKEPATFDLDLAERIRAIETKLGPTEAEKQKAASATAHAEALAQRSGQPGQPGQPTDTDASAAEAKPIPKQPKDKAPPDGEPEET